MSGRSFFLLLFFRFFFFVFFFFFSRIEHEWSVVRSQIVGFEKSREELGAAIPKPPPVMNSSGAAEKLRANLDELAALLEARDKAVQVRGRRRVCGWVRVWVSCVSARGQARDG